MLYRPSLSLTAVRTFSISAGLDASTVTPGSTPPELSLTTPAIPLDVGACADAVTGNSSAHIMMLRPTPTTFVRSIDFLLLLHPWAQAAISDTICIRICH